MTYSIDALSMVPRTSYRNVTGAFGRAIRYIGETNMDRQWYETQVTRYAPIFDDSDANTKILHIELGGVIYETTEEGMMEHWRANGHLAPRSSKHSSMTRKSVMARLPNTMA